MKNVELIEKLLAQAKIEHAIEALLQLCQKNNSENYPDVIVLSAQHNSIQRQERIGLGDFNKELSRIIKALLSILQEEKEAESSTIEDAAQKNLGNLETKIIRLEEKVDQLLGLISIDSRVGANELTKEYFWRNLEKESKIYLNVAERELGLEEVFDYSSAIIQYSKVLETEFLNKVLFKIKGGKIGDDSEMEYSYGIVIQRIIDGLLSTTHEKVLNKQIHKVFFIISQEELVNDLKILLDSKYRERAAKPNVMTRKEVEDCRELTLRVLINLMNRPYSAVSGLNMND